MGGISCHREESHTVASGGKCGLEAPHNGSFNGRLIARDDFSLREVGSLLEHEPVGKRIQSCKSRHVMRLLEKDFLISRSDCPLSFYSLKTRGSITLSTTS
jgi:hypothetical protein